MRNGRAATEVDTLRLFQTGRRGAGREREGSGQNGVVAHFDDIPGLGVWLEVLDGGTVRIIGQDLQPPAGFGGEYEYSMTIAAADAPHLADALGTDLAGIPEAWEAQVTGIVLGGGERRWLRDHGIPHEFWSRIGE